MTFRSIYQNGSFPSGAIILSVAAVFYFVVMPMHGKISEEHDNIQKFYAREESAAEKLKRLPELEKQFELIQKEDGTLAVPFPVSDIVDFIKKVEETAAATGNTISIEQSTTQAAPPKKPVAAAGADDKTAPAAVPAKGKKLTVEDTLPWRADLRVNITVTGEYANVVQFLHKFESLRYPLDVLSISVVPVAPDAGIRAGSGVNIFTPQDGTAVVLPEAPQKNQVTLSFQTAVYLQESK